MVDRLPISNRQADSRKDTSIFDVSKETRDSISGMVNPLVEKIGQAVAPFVPGMVPVGTYAAKAEPAPVPRPAVPAGIVTAPPVTPPTPEDTGPTPEEQTKASLEALYNQVLGQRAAPGVGMNKDLVRGLEGQQAALRGPIGVMEQQEPGMEAARAGLQTAGQRYMTGLEKLRGEQKQLFDARRAAMQADEARMAEAEGAFDASRVVRQVAESPLKSSALAFAAGLVGGLKGLAGDMSPNQILSQVDKAVERDVMTQKEQYERMRQGMAARRTNYLDAVQMGANEQEALAAATMASMDQHKRALEFAKDRIENATDKAKLQQAISQLDVQRGQFQLQVDMKNAANWVAMNKAKTDSAIAIRKMLMDVQGMNPELRAKAADQASKIVNDKEFRGAADQYRAVSKVKRLMTEMPESQQAELYNAGIGRTIYDAVQRAAADTRGGSKGLFIGTLADMIGSKMSEAKTNEQRQLLGMVQRIVNQEMSNLYGSTVSAGDMMRYLPTENFKTYEGFKSWIEGRRQDAKDKVDVGRKLANAYGKEVSNIVNLTLAPAEADFTAADQALAQEAAMKAGAVK